MARHTGRELPRELRPDATHDATRERKQQRALALWHGSEAAVDTLADCYLTARGLPSLAASSAIRFRGDTPHLEGGRLPAMIALVTDVNGTPVAVHRTYLNRDGGKANVKPAKASLGPVWGGSIRLHPIVAEYPLVIGEGIETAASAGRRMGCPAWAAPETCAKASCCLLRPATSSSPQTPMTADAMLRTMPGVAGPTRDGKCRSQRPRGQATSTTFCKRGEWPMRRRGLTPRHMRKVMEEIELLRGDTVSDDAISPTPARHRGAEIFVPVTSIPGRPRTGPDDFTIRDVPEETGPSGYSPRQAAEAGIRTGAERVGGQEVGLAPLDARR